MCIELAEEQVFVPKAKCALVRCFREFFGDQAQQVPKKGDVLHQLFNQDVWQDKCLNHALRNYRRAACRFIDEGLFPEYRIWRAGYKIHTIQDDAHLAVQQHYQVVCFLPFGHDDRAILVKAGHLRADLTKQLSRDIVENRQEGKVPVRGVLLLHGVRSLASFCILSREPFFSDCGTGKYKSTVNTSVLLFNRLREYRSISRIKRVVQPLVAYLLSVLQRAERSIDHLVTMLSHENAQKFRDHDSRSYRPNEEGPDGRARQWRQPALIESCCRQGLIGREAEHSLSRTPFSDPSPSIARRTARRKGMT